jgi:hypothetical protein
MNAAHFNGLTPAEAERLAILAEECAEVIQVVGKILRHGYESRAPKMPDSETNRQMLQRELGDLGHAARRMEIAADVNPFAISARASSKSESIKAYLHHQEPDTTKAVE